MKDYIIVTDSTIDLTDEMAKELGILVLPMTFTIDGKDYKNYLDGREIGLKEFYQKMENGSTPKTAQLNVNYIMEHAKPVLDKNLDVLYISFSSDVSILTFFFALIFVDALIAFCVSFNLLRAISTVLSLQLKKTTQGLSVKYIKFHHKMLILLPQPM